MTENKQLYEEIVEGNEQAFFKEETQMALRHMKKMYRLPSCKEIQIKNTIRFHLTLARIAYIQKCTNMPAGMDVVRKMPDSRVFMRI